MQAKFIKEKYYMIEHFLALLYMQFRKERKFLLDYFQLYHTSVLRKENFILGFSNKSDNRFT